MKNLILLAAIAFLSAALSAMGADAKSDVKSAAKKLADQANYSWTQAIKMDGANPNFRPGPIEGKTEKGGYTHYAGTMGDNTYEAAFKGEKSAFKGQDEWQSAAELEGDDRGAFIARRLKTFKAPAAEAEDILGKVKELKKGDDGACSGDFTDEGVKDLLTRWGRRTAAEFKDTKGSAKFWIKDGVLSKYEYRVQGAYTRDSGEEVKIDRTTTVEIKDVGTTKVTVPEEARKKLS